MDPDRTTDRLGADSERTARVAVVVGLAGLTLLWVHHGVRRWFVADDWSYLLFRSRSGPGASTPDRLFTDMNGHPVAGPALAFRVVARLFGWSSYTPFVVVAITVWVLCAMVLFALIRRCDTPPITAAVVTLAAAATGAATEIPTLAAIVNFEVSLLTGLTALLTVERTTVEHQSGWRALAAVSVVGTIGALSSSFGPVFMLAAGMSAIAQRRRPLAVAALAPTTVVYAWWWLAFGPGSTSGASTPASAPAYAAQVLGRTVEGIVGFGLGPLVLLGTAMCGASLTRSTTGRIAGSTAVVAVASALVVGWRRSELGTEPPVIGRYVAVFAVLLAPLVAVTIGRLARFGARPMVAVHVLLLTTVVVHSTEWRRDQISVIDAVNDDRALLDLLAGADVSELDPDFRPSRCAPDVRLRDLADLVARGVLRPRSPDGAEERTLLESTLAIGRGEPPGSDPRPCRD